MLPQFRDGPGRGRLFLRAPTAGGDILGDD